MSADGNKTQIDFMLEIKAEIEKTLDDYDNVLNLRRKTLEQDIEQIKVYYEIIQKQPQTNLNPKLIRRITNVLKKKNNISSGMLNCSKRQELLEKRFLLLQDALVGLISKQFKYR